MLLAFDDTQTYNTLILVILRVAKGSISIATIPCLRQKISFGCAIGNKLGCVTEDQADSDDKMFVYKVK